ncbi:MAG: glycosyltransferase family 2 protein [Bacteroidota bacterium]
MKPIEYVFWISLFIVFYAYIGYGIVLYLLVIVKNIFIRKKAPLPFYPEVTLVVPAYNEFTCIAAKLKNSLALDYPKEKLQLLFVAEGSTDGTLEFLQAQPGIEVIGGLERKGKIDAINRAMQLVKTPIVVFSDANTALNKDAITKLVSHYTNPAVAAVAGEKRMLLNSAEGATGAGEGIYWKYESLLKRLDSELNTIVGAAGELFSMRTALFIPVEVDTLLDDFMISMRLAGRGYLVKYEPQAYASETPSHSVQEEMKRKIRISAGGFQSIKRLGYLLNPFRYGLLTFQYVSHRVLRWAVAPFCLVVLLLSNAWLAMYSSFYLLIGIGQVAFYFLAAMGYLLEQRKIRVKILYIPFYFSFMNYCIYLGLMRYIQKTQTQLWEKSIRA